MLAGLFKLDSSLALSYVVVLHAALLLPRHALWGLFYMARESVSWGELAALEKKEAAGQARREPDDDESGPGAGAAARPRTTAGAGGRERTRATDEGRAGRTAPQTRRRTERRRRGNT